MYVLLSTLCLLDFIQNIPHIFIIYILKHHVKIVFFNFNALIWFFLTLKYVKPSTSYLVPQLQHVIFIQVLANLGAICLRSELHSPQNYKQIYPHKLPIYFLLCYGKQMNVKCDLTESTFAHSKFSFQTHSWLLRR